MTHNNIVDFQSYLNKTELFIKLFNKYKPNILFKVIRPKESLIIDNYTLTDTDLLLNFKLQRPEWLNNHQFTTIHFDYIILTILDHYNWLDFKKIIDYSIESLNNTTCYCCASNKSNEDFMITCINCKYIYCNNCSINLFNDAKLNNNHFKCINCNYIYCDNLLLNNYNLCNMHYRNIKFNLNKQITYNRIY